MIAVVCERRAFLLLPLRAADATVPRVWYMEHMDRRTTVILRADEDAALRAASRAEGVSQSELIRRGIALVTAPYAGRTKPRVGWLKLSPRQRDALRNERMGDPDE
jgi:hypothetical protein